MRRRIATVIVLLALAPLACAQAKDGGTTAKQTRPDETVVQEPMFGLKYSYLHSNVRYDLVPVSVRHVCSDLDKGTYWVYAHTTRGSTQYYVVLGVIPYQIGMGDALGAALAIHGNSCIEYDSTHMFEGVVPPGGYKTPAISTTLPGMGTPEIRGNQSLRGHYYLQSAADEQLLRDFARDGLRRGTRAWGGEVRFRDEVCNPAIVRENAITPLVGEELKKFCKDRH